MNKGLFIAKCSLGIIVISLLIFFVFVMPNNKNGECAGPYISLTFDDGYKDQYLNAFPILQKHNITATSYIIAGLVGGYFENESLMSWDDIDKLKENGWEIGSHTLTHPDLTLPDDNKLDYELSEAKIILKNRGFDAISLSIPYGKYNKQIENLAGVYYNSARTSEFGVNNLESINRFNLKSVWPVNSTSLSEIKSWIDNINTKNKTDKDAWLIFMFHHIRNNSISEYSTDSEELDEIIKYARQKDIKIRMVSEVLDECNEK